MDHALEFLKGMEGNQYLVVLGQVFTALAGLGMIDTVMRKLPWVRSSLVYVAKGIRLIKQVLLVAANGVELAERAVFWLNDKLGLAIEDVRPPLAEAKPVEPPPANP